MYRWLSPVVFDWLSPFYRSDAGSGSGAAGGNTQSDDDDDELEDPPAPASTGNTAADGLIRDFFERNRAWVKVQNRKVGRYRRRAVDAEHALAELRNTSEQQPKATKEDLDELTAYRALGKVDEVKTKVETGTAAVTEIATLKRDSVVRDAADVAGYNFDVLRDRVTNQELIVREVDENGQKVKKAYIKPEQGSEKLLTEYASEHWTAYLPALVASGNGESNSRDTAQQQQFPGQGPARNGNTQGPRSNVQVASAYTRSVYTGPPKRG